MSRHADDHQGTMGSGVVGAVGAGGVAVAAGGGVVGAGGVVVAAGGVVVVAGVVDGAAGVVDGAAGGVVGAAGVVVAADGAIDGIGVGTSRHSPRTQSPSSVVEEAFERHAEHSRDT